MNLTDFLQNFTNVIYSKIPQPKPSKDLAQNCKIIAHRGAWDKINCLENTVPAFDKCLKAKIWAIEFDIQWTQDNIPVVHHDSNTTRVFKKDISIKNTSYKELNSLIPEIPSLKELVNLFGEKIHFMIELKSSPTEEQLQVLKDTLSPLSPIADYHFMSLDIQRFSFLKGFPFQCFVAIGRTDLADIHKKSLNMNIGALTGHYLLFPKSFQSMQHNLGRKTGVGFPASKNGLYREINRNFSWIFTNHAEKLQQHLNQLID